MMSFYKRLKIYKELEKLSFKELHIASTICSDLIVSKFINSVLKETEHYSLGSLRLEQLFVDFYTKYRNYNFWRKVVFSQNESILDLSKDSILAFPWNKSRLLPLLSDFGQEGFLWKEDTLNHDVTLIAPFNIYFAYSGNHSIATGRFYRKGVIHCHQKVDYSPVLNDFDFDGKYFRTLSKHKINRPYFDELGELFIIGKILVERKQNT